VKHVTPIDPRAALDPHTVLHRVSINVFWLIAEPEFTRAMHSRQDQENASPQKQQQQQQQQQQKDWQDVLNGLQSDYQALTRRYDAVLGQYKAIPTVLVNVDNGRIGEGDLVSEKQKLAMVLRQLLVRMEEKV
jgi:type IV secretory pathway VirB10-like protein